MDNKRPRPQHPIAATQRVKPKTTTVQAKRQGAEYSILPAISQGNGVQRIRVAMKGSPTPVGSVDICPDSNGRLEIFNLKVAPQHRRRGVGTILMNSALKSAQSQGLKATLEARPSDGTIPRQALVGMYQKIGFRNVGASGRGNPMMVHGAGGVQPKMGPVGQRPARPMVIQRMEKERGKLQKGRNAAKYSREQRNEIEKQALKFVPANKVAATINQAIASLPSDVTSKVGHASEDPSHKTRGGNTAAVSGFNEALSDQLEVMAATKAAAPSKPKVNYNRPADVEAQRTARKEEKQQQKEGLAVHQSTHEANRLHIKKTGRKPDDTNISNVRHTYVDCGECHKYWVPVKK